MTRTNIDIDDEAVALVMHRYRISTKREAVDFALRQLVGRVSTPEEAMELEGSGWEGDLGAMRDATAS